MKKNWKKAVALAMASAMMVGSLSACGGNGSTPTNNTTAAPTGGGSTTAAPTTKANDDTTAAPENNVAGIEGWTPFSNRVHITVPVYDRSKEGYPAVDDNYWTKWVQTEFGDKYNIDVEYVAIPRGDVMTKYNLLIAADDTPTILMEYDYPKVAEWASSGAMQVIDLEAFKQVAPNYYQKMVDNNQLAYTDINNETYFVLSERPYYNTGYTFLTFVRMDWLRQVGYDHVPNSYEEHKDAINKIIEAKITDQAPMPLSLPTTAYCQNFNFRTYPVDEAEWAMHSSLGTPSLSWEPTYKMLKRQNAEYNMGWYSTEYELDADGSDGNTSSQQKTDFINGKSYQYAQYVGPSVDWLVSFYENNPDAELAIASSYAVVEPGFVDFPQNRADNPFGMIVGFSSLATEDELKAAWMYMEWMLAGKDSNGQDVLFTMENGIEGVTYTLNEEGLPVVDAAYRGTEMLNHNCNIDMTCIVHASKVDGTIEQSIKANVPKGIPQDFTQAMLDNYKVLKEIADAQHAYSDPVFSVEIKSESEYSATLLSVYQEASVRLTKCKPEEFDAIYAEEAQKFLDAGYQEIIDERKAAYEAGNTTKLPWNK